MFKDEYKNSLNDISPDSYIKQKVLKQIENGNKKKTPFKAVVITSVAVAASLVIVFTSIAAAVIINNPFEKTVDVGLADEFVNEEVETSVVTNEGENYSGTGGFINDYTSSWNGNTEKYEKVYDGDVIFDTSYSEVFKIINDIKNAGSNSWGSVSIGGASLESSNNYSTTTTQVSDVDESDIIKTNGKYIYSIGTSWGKTNQTYSIRVIKAGSEPTLENEVIINTDNTATYNVEMYLFGNRLVVTATTYKNSIGNTRAYIYDISNSKYPKLICTTSQSGVYETSRMVGNVLYLVSNYDVVTSKIKKESPQTFVPVINAKNHNGAVKADTIFLNSNRSEAVYTVVAAFDVNTGNLLDSQSSFGKTSILYCSTNSVLITSPRFNNTTVITRIAITKGDIRAVASKKISGGVKNQFCIDEYANHIRIVTSNGTYANGLLVLDFLLNQVGNISNIAKGEQVNSAVFDGNIAYFATYKEVDPIFTVDLSNPEKPKVIGSLKIDGLPNYLFKYGDGKLLGFGTELDPNNGNKPGVRLSMYDTSTPSNITEINSIFYDKLKSAALNNHKAILCDAKRNYIGFAGKDYNYYLLEFKDGKFNVKGKYNFNGNNCRGLYVNDFFYVVSDDDVTTIDLNTLDVVSYSRLS